MAFRAVPKFLGIRVCLHFFMLYVICSHLLAKAAATFMVRDSEDNEVIFAGETITLQCEAPSNVFNPMYDLLDGQRNSLGVFGFSLPDNPRQVNFQIMIRDLNEKIFFCAIMEDGNLVMMEQLRLDITDHHPVCYMDSGPVVVVGDLLELSCYRYGGLGLSFGAVWKQIKDDMPQDLLGVESDVINQSKRKTSATVVVDSDDNGSIFQCELTTVEGSLTCQTTRITVQGSLTVSITTTNNGPLDRGESTLATCESSEASATITWENNYDSSAVGYTNFANTILVEIPETTTLSSGTVLSFTCTALLEGQSRSSTFMISAIFRTTPVATVPPDFTVRITTDNSGPIGINEEFTATCHSSISGAIILWNNVYNDTDIHYMNTGDTITVSVPRTTTLATGTNLIFRCVGILQGRQEIATFVIQLIFSTPTTAHPAPTLGITTNNLGTIGINEEFSATCRSSSDVVIVWFHEYSDTDITYSNNENVITVSIPESTTLTTGTNLVFTCLGLPTSTTATLEVKFMLSSTMTSLTATADYTSMVTTESGDDNQSDPPANDPMPVLYYVLGGIFAAVLVAIIIIIIVLICLTQQSHPKRKSFRDDGHGHNTTFNNAYIDQPSAHDGPFQDTQPTRADRGDGYSTVDKTNGFHVHQGPRNDDGAAYSDVNRRRVSIHEEDIYNDSLGWNGEI